jgi:uncharacterized membrane protein YfcA
MITDPLLWTFALFGALMVGVSKAGITGLSILSIALFTQVFPSSKQASGLILPLLIFGDFVAVFAYRKHTQWHYLWRMFPWTALGVVIGYFTLGRISDHTAKTMIGAIIVGLVILSFWRRYASAAHTERATAVHWSIAALIGITAGFITLIANAAAPLMAIYFVAMKLPKMEYVGTAAVFFMLLNLFKVPFMVNLGLITTASFGFNLMLAPAVVLGALAGRWLLTKINQNRFEQMVLILSAIGGILLFL